MDEQTNEVRNGTLEKKLFLKSPSHENSFIIQNPKTKEIMHRDVFGYLMKTPRFCILNFPCKISLFEKLYQTLATVFHHNIKNLEVRQKYSATRRIFNSLLGV